MRKISIIQITIVTLILTVSFGTANAAAQGNLNREQKIETSPYPGDDLFFEVTRPIMLKDEVKIYKHLPDRAARKSFIEDFWKKRDPTPGTEINENRIEYERRLAFANRWFKEKTHSGKGWDSDRGKVYVLLGQPDQRSTQQSTIIDRLGYRKRVLTEIWVYDYYRLYLRFVDEEGLGRYRLRQWPLELLSAIDRAKFAIHPLEEKEPFTFKAHVKQNNLFIDIPTRLVNFQEELSADKVETQFRISLFIYHQYKKIRQLEETQVVRDTREDFLNRKKIRLTLPVPLPTRGKYLLDIIVEELDSGAKYRDMITCKL